MLVEHHPTLSDATCRPRLNTILDDVCLNLNLLKIFVQHRATLLASFEQALSDSVFILSTQRKTLEAQETSTATTQLT